MQTGRLNQLKKIGKNRVELESSINKLNQEILKDEKIKESLDNYIKEMILSDDFNLLKFEELKVKLYKIKGTSINLNQSIYNSLYFLIINNILLPDYGVEKDSQLLVTDIKQIINNGIKRINREFIDVYKQKYNLILGNISEILDTVTDNIGLGEIDYLLENKDFYIGNVFGNNKIGYDRENYAFQAKISVRTSVIAKTGGEDDSDIFPYISEKTIKNQLKTILPNKTKTGGFTNFQDNFLRDYTITFENQRNEDYELGFDNGNKYLNIIISHNEASELSLNNYTQNEVIGYLDDLLKVNNLIVNFLIDENELDFSKKVINYEQGLDYNQEDIKIINNEIDNSNLKIDEKTIQNFSKLLVSEKSNVSINDIGGQKEAKQKAMEFIKSVKESGVFESWGAKLSSGSIFEGAPGTGKTILAEAIANEIDANVIKLKFTDINSSAFINDGANNIKKLFDYIKYLVAKSDKKVLIILDELDAMFEKRTNTEQSKEDKKVVNVFISEFNEIANNSKIMFIGTTNLISSIDESVIRSGRMDNQIKFSLPDEEGRIEIFKIHINKYLNKSIKAKSILENLCDENLKILSKQTQGFTGADIEKTINDYILLNTIYEIDNKSIKEFDLNDISEIIKNIKNKNNKQGFINGEKIETLKNYLEDKNVGEVYRKVILDLIYESSIKELRELVTKGDITKNSLLELVSIESNNSMGFLNNK